MQELWIHLGDALQLATEDPPPDTSGPDPWAGVLPTVVTSFLTTLITLGLTGLVAWFTLRKNKRATPIRVKRGSGNSYYVVNESRRPFTSIFANVTDVEGRFRSPIPYPGAALLPTESRPLGNLVEGETVIIQWNEFRRGKKITRYVDVIRIGVAEEYRPRLRKEPDVMHGG